jgi:hypothetical protein
MPATICPECGHDDVPWSILTGADPYSECEKCGAQVDVRPLQQGRNGPPPDPPGGWRHFMTDFIDQPELEPAEFEDLIEADGDEIAALASRLRKLRRAS